MIKASLKVGLLMLEGYGQNQAEAARALIAGWHQYVNSNERTKHRYDTAAENIHRFTYVAIQEGGGLVYRPDKLGKP